MLSSRAIAGELGVLVLGTRKLLVELCEAVHDLIDRVVFKGSSKMELPLERNLVNYKLFEVIGIDVILEDLAIQLLLVSDKLVDSLGSVELAVGELV